MKLGLILIKLGNNLEKRFITKLRINGLTMDETQRDDPKEEKRNFNALQKALEALKLAMENQLPKSEKTGLESLL